MVTFNDLLLIAKTAGAIKSFSFGAGRALSFEKAFLLYRENQVRPKLEKVYFSRLWLVPDPYMHVIDLSYRRGTRF